MLLLSIFVLLNVFTFGASLACFWTPTCNCSVEFFDEYKFECGLQLKIPIEVRVKPLYHVRILCIQEESGISSQWPDLLEGLNVSGSYKEVQIQRCPIPEKSIQWIFRQLAVVQVEKLILDYQVNRGNTFQAHHFENLDSVEHLSLMYSNITTLPDTVFKGLPNLKRLLLNNNRLLSVPTGLFKPVPKVTFLDLGRNNLTDLDPDVFKHLPNLKLLNIYGNRLRNLKRQTFSYFRNLTQLDLNSNGITTLEEGLFRDLFSLTTLNLNFNNISTLPEGIFSNMTSLQQVRVAHSYNSKSVSLPAELFSNLGSLVEITMDKNNLTHLPENVFRRSTKLQFVSLNTNHLTWLPGSLFVDCVKLQRVDVSRNKLTALNVTIFRGLKDLKKLLLNHNQLTFINGSAFQGLSSLEELDLENNRLAYLEFNVFKDLNKLRIIRLSNNRLTMRLLPDLSSSLLNNCPQIEEIHLRNNSVDAILEDWVISDMNLRILDLSYNKIEKLSSDELQFIAADRHAVKVNLSNNQIRTVDMVYFENNFFFSCDSPPCEDRYRPRYLEVILANNPLVCDCESYDLIRYFQQKMNPAAFKQVSISPNHIQCSAPGNLKNMSIAKVRLEDVYCSWDKLRKDFANDTCPKGCTCTLWYANMVLVINCTNLRSLPEKLPQSQYIQLSNGKQLGITGIDLILSNNGLRSLKEVSELLPPKIMKLTMSSNALKNIDDLKLPKSLKVLELDHNEISHLDKRTIEKLNQTNPNTTITLHNNPWQCDCETKDLLNFIQARFSKIPHIYDITCVTSGKSLINLTVDDLCGISLTLIIVCVSLASFGLIFGIITFLYYKYEHELKVWMFAHKICLWLVTEKEVDRNKKYDAFISYSHLDEDFIAKHLKPGLENGPTPFKLCLHYRDWLVGDFIPEQVVRSVESSRRTIVVLSPNYLDSVWGIMEFRTAYLKAVKERRPRVIVVLLKDIDASAKMDPELKAYLTMNTYLKWGDPWFWEKLRYAMPHPQQYSKQPISLTKEMQNVKDSFRVNKKLNITPCLEIKIEKDEKSGKPTLLCSG